MSDAQDSLAGALLRMIAAACAWFGSITLMQLSLVVAIVSGLLTAVFVGMQSYVLWRDKIKDRHDENR